MPGEAFGSPGYLRFSYALGDDDLVEGITRMQKLLRPERRRHGDDPADTRAGRSLTALPKAHLHLHFTGSMRHTTLLELAERDGIVLPDALVEDWPPRLSAADEKGWFRFQRLYDVARSVLRTEDDVRRLVREAAEDDVGGRRRAGWRSRSTRAATPRGSAGSPRSPTWCSTPSGTPPRRPASGSRS